MIPLRGRALQSARAAFGAGTGAGRVTGMLLRSPTPVRGAGHRRGPGSAAVLPACIREWPLSLGCLRGGCGVLSRPQAVLLRAGRLACPHAAHLEVWPLIVFPAISALVLAGLTGAVLRQWRARHRPQQLAWVLSLAWGLIGALAYIGSVLGGDNAWLFRLYYMGGAVLVAPLLGVGSAYLLPRQLWARLLIAVTALCAVLAAVGLAVFPLDAAALALLASGAGSAAVTSPLVIIPVIVGNTLGTVAVVGVALRSVVQALFQHRPWNFVWGNGLIAVGTLGIAAAGSMARLGHGAGFWGTMSLGWIVLYVGFTLMAVAPAPQSRPVTV